MIEAKLIEVRDRATFIPAIAVRLEADLTPETYVLRRCGYNPGTSSVQLTWLPGGATQGSSFEWRGACRTMRVAHEHLEKHWDSVPSGGVVDVEFVLGEAPAPKKSERLYASLDY